MAIFVKGIPGTVGNNELQTVFNTEALVGRFESGHCKVLVPESELGRALSQNSVSGHEIRVKKWRVREDHHPTVPQAASFDTRRSGRRNQHRKIPSAVCTTSVSNGLIKERAYFVAEFLAAQARPRGVSQKSGGQQQLYSHVIGPDKAEVRMKSMETAIYDIRRLLERLV